MKDRYIYTYSCVIVIRLTSLMVTLESNPYRSTVMGEYGIDSD